MNVFQEEITAEKPKSLSEERIYVYVPRATADNTDLSGAVGIAGIATYDGNDFRLDSGKVYLKQNDPTVRPSLIKILSDPSEGGLVYDNGYLKVSIHTINGNSILGEGDTVLATLDDVADAVAELDAKVVHLAGTETITGNKTFTGTLTAGNLVSTNEITTYGGSEVATALDVAMVQDDLDSFKTQVVHVDTTNLVNYYLKTETYSKDEIDTKMTTVYKIKGSVATYADLPAEGNEIGDVYNVIAAYGDYPAGTNYVWTEDSVWDPLGGAPIVGEQQSIAINGTTENSVMTFVIPESTVLTNNTEYDITLNCDITIPEDSALTAYTLVMTYKGNNVYLRTPYNMISTANLEMSNLAQAPHYDYNNTTHFKFKGFLNIASDSTITIYVDMDDLSYISTIMYNSTTTQVNNAIDNILYKEWILGADGVITNNVAVFTIQDAEALLYLRRNNTSCILDLLLGVTGEIDESSMVAIEFGDTTYYLYSVYDGTTRLTLRDLRQVAHPSTETGTRYIFPAVFYENSDITGFAIAPSVNRNDIISVTATEMANYLTNGGIPVGQLVICTEADSAGIYSLGMIYRFDIVTYPSTYEWTELTKSGVTVDNSTITENTSGQIQAVGLQDAISGTTLTANDIYLACTIERSDV